MTQLSSSMKKGLWKSAVQVKQAPRIVLLHLPPLFVVPSSNLETLQILYVSQIFQCRWTCRHRISASKNRRHLLYTYLCALYAKEIKHQFLEEREVDRFWIWKSRESANPTAWSKRYVLYFHTSRQPCTFGGILYVHASPWCRSPEGHLGRFLLAISVIYLLKLRRAIYITYHWNTIYSTISIYRIHTSPERSL